MVDEIKINPEKLTYDIIDSMPYLERTLCLEQRKKWIEYERLKERRKLKNEANRRYRKIWKLKHELKKSY
jgi:hypothetical protein